MTISRLFFVIDAYSTGDMYKIAVKWTEFAPRVVEIHPELFAEMYGFIYSTVELNLPFTLIKSIVVSVTTTPYVYFSVFS